MLPTFNKVSWSPILNINCQKALSDTKNSSTYKKERRDDTSGIRKELGEKHRLTEDYTREVECSEDAA